MYWNTTDFGVLILYPATLLNSFFNSCGFVMYFSEFSVCRIMSPANNENFYSSFPIWMNFLSFSCLNALARTSITMMKNSGDTGHPCHDLSVHDFNTLGIYQEVVFLSNMVIIYLTIWETIKLFSTVARPVYIQFQHSKYKALHNIVSVICNLMSALVIHSHLIYFVLVYTVHD